MHPSSIQLERNAWWRHKARRIFLVLGSIVGLTGWDIRMFFSICCGWDVTIKPCKSIISIHPSHVDPYVTEYCLPFYKQNKQGAFF